MGAEHSLSILQYLGFSPLCRSRVWTSLNVCRCSAPALVFRQRIRIELMLYIYTNIMYRYPRLEMMGKSPVWSEKIVLVGWKDKNAFLFFDGGWVAGEGLQLFWWTRCFGIVGRGDSGYYWLMGAGVL